MALKNSSLERGLSVLDLLSRSEGDLGVREIARRLGLSPAAIQRIVNTLAEQQYVEQSLDTSRYGLGSAVVGLARNALQKNSLTAAAEPVLKEIVAASIFNAFLGIRRGGTGFYLLALQSRSPVVIRSSPGDAFLLHSTALGKALLLDHDEEALLTILGPGPYKKLTDKTVTLPHQLLKQAERAVRRGYTSSAHEAFPGIVSLGAPLRTASGSIIGAISLAYPLLVGDPQELSDAGELIASAASRISAAL